MWYVLDENNNPVKSDLEESNKFLKDIQRRVVAHDQLPDGSLLSTVFLCMDHSYGVGDPVLFESMWFGGPYEGHQRRYKTWQEALEGHASMLESHREYLEHVADKLSKM